MIHTATLLHDDVVDESKLRRGHATANATFGNAASVLVGDFLYSRAFQLMVSVGLDARAGDPVAGDQRDRRGRGAATHEHRATRPRRDRLSAGDPAQDGEALRSGRRSSGAVLGGADPEREAALARYGMHLGTSFQLVDDVLDYMGDATAYSARTWATISPKGR